MSGHEKEEWEKEPGWTALGWAELQCRWSDRGLGSKPGQRAALPRQLQLATPKRAKEYPDCATAWCDLSQLSRAATSSHESDVF